MSQKSSEETVANMKKLHGEALVAKEEEMSARIDKAVVCTPGWFNLLEFNTCR